MYQVLDLLRAGRSRAQLAQFGSQARVLRDVDIVRQGHTGQQAEAPGCSDRGTEGRGWDCLYKELNRSQNCAYGNKL